MSGKFAYTALPAVVTPLVYPPGWNPGWDFLAATPRAYPPGYTPEFSIVATGTNFTTTQHGIHISSILYDHGTYTTNEPSAASEVIITAFIDGVSHKLRFSGDITFLDAIACSYSSVSGGLWGTDSYIDVDFDMSGHDGKTLTFVVAGVVEGQIFTDTVSMGIRYSSSIALPLMAAKGTIRAPTVSSGGIYTCEFDVTWSHVLTGSEFIGVFVSGTTGYKYATWQPITGAFYGGTLSASDFSALATPGYCKLTELLGSQKMLRSFSLDLFHWPDAAMNMQFRTYDSVGALIDTYNKTEFGIVGWQGPRPTWLTFNSSTGVVTIINP